MEAVFNERGTPVGRTLTDFSSPWLPKEFNVWKGGHGWELAPRSGKGSTDQKKSLPDLDSVCGAAHVDRLCKAGKWFQSLKRGCNGRKRFQSRKMTPKEREKAPRSGKGYSVGRGFQLLRRNATRFRGGLVSKAHGMVFHKR